MKSYKLVIYLQGFSNFQLIQSHNSSVLPQLLHFKYLWYNTIYIKRHNLIEQNKSYNQEYD